MEIQAGNTILREHETLAERLVDRQFELDHSLADRYGPEDREQCLRDAQYHLDYLAEALRVGSTQLFIEYVNWAASLLTSRNVPTDDLILNLRSLRMVLAENLPPHLGDPASVFVSEALDALGVAAEPSEEEAGREESLRSLAQLYLQAVKTGDQEEAYRLIHTAVDEGTSVRDIYLHVFQWTQHEIGRLWQTNRLTVAQEHLATAMTRQIMAQLGPFFTAPVKHNKTFVMACVAKEQHEIGARMVTDFFALEGWTTYYLGADVPIADVVDIVKRYEADVLGISATLTIHLGRVSELIQAIRSDPATRDVRVLVGGYPFNIDPDIWLQLGADGYARSADLAVQQAERLIAA